MTATGKYADLNARDRMIVALDLPGVDEARQLVDRLGDSVSFYKIGFQLVLSGGLELARQLKQEGKQVFLDMKLLDIDATVEKAVANAARLGIDMLTIHAYPKAMRAAVAGANGSGVCLLGVTVLTSMDDGDLADAGYASRAEEMVAARAADARAAGMCGVVASAHEAAMLRSVLGPDMAIVTPGIRPAGSEKGDQKRVMTPAEALAAGATHLVIGRPVNAAQDPVSAANTIVAEMETAQNA